MGYSGLNISCQINPQHSCSVVLPSPAAYAEPLPPPLPTHCSRKPSAGYDGTRQSRPSLLWQTFAKRLERLSNLWRRSYLSVIIAESVLMGCIGV